MNERVRSLQVSSRRNFEENPTPSSSLSQFRKALDEQQEEIANLLEELRTDVDDKFDDRNKHNFQKKYLEKQFDVNHKILRLNGRVKAAVKEGNKKKAIKFLEEQQELLKCHGEDLVTADQSKYGWLTVQKLKSTSCLRPSQLKKIEKVEALIERTQPRSGSGVFNRGIQYGATFRNGFQMDKGIQDQGFRTRRRMQKQSPEQAMKEAVKQSRPGVCSHCHDPGHFYRECPEFWRKALQSRKAKEDKN